ncbi:MAG: DUF72 domain-containing protein [Deferribacterota bacterium]|nr:DUF72 domain-containing protein [Deferribacterota bacterium]
MIYVGTSGFRHNSWVDKIYPVSLRPTNYLKYYINNLGLSFVEITFTFHKMPYYKTIDQIAENIGNNSLALSIKLYKELLKESLNEEYVRTFIDALAPLNKDNIVYVLLADFPYSFTASRKNVETILNLKRLFEKNIFFVSLPHRSWYKERYFNLFREKNIGTIIHYIPLHSEDMTPFTPITTNKYAYFRIYSNKFLYLQSMNKNIAFNYNTKQLKSIANEVNKLSIVTKDTFVAFCNIRDGYSVYNAQSLNKILKEYNDEP